MSARAAYLSFLERRAQVRTRDGFRPLWLPDSLFGFQAALCEWAIEAGRSATLADCGMGKTAMQLVWAENVVRHTNRPVLILTPLAVAPQTVTEGEKFGVACRRDVKGATVVVTNYERLHHYDPADFAGVVCDESSILKSFDGARRGEITAFMRKMRYRLLCTATAAPNDYTELGTSSEALGYLGHMDMLHRFFKPIEQGYLNRRDTTGGGAWRFKGHSEEAFWRWVCSWARALRRPSDLGFNDDGFTLPPLEQHEHCVASRTLPEGMNAPRAGRIEYMEVCTRGLTEEAMANLRAYFLREPASGPAGEPGELLPCPFCGAQPNCWDDGSKDGPSYWSVTCSACPAMLDTYFADGPPGEAAGRTAAIAAWNRRAPQAAPPAGHE